jgi:antitoxin VapB
MGFETIEIQNKEGIQEIRIPENFKINDDKVYLKRMGNALFIIPFHNPWQSLQDSLEQFSSDFMTSRNQPTQQIREPFDS